MRRFAISLVAAVLGIIAAFAAPAFAQTTKFEDLAAQAVPAANPRGFAALLWSYVATCDGPAGSMERRQCEGLRRARQAQLAGRTFRVAGDAGAFTVGDWDDKKKSAPIVLRSCVACVAPLAVDGHQLFVVGGVPTIAGGVVRAAAVHESARTFQDDGAAQAWKRDIVPRLLTELVVRIANGGKVWSQGDVSGLQLEVVGFRVHDPCDGGIVVANPESSAAPVDKQACRGEPVVENTTVVVKPDQPIVPAKPKLPRQLTTAQIREALSPASDAASLCYDHYGVAGQANFHLTIDNAGNVTAVEQEGDFTDTPTGTCIDKAVRAVKFPETSKKRTTMVYPFILR